MSINNNVSKFRSTFKQIINEIFDTTEHEFKKVFERKGVDNIHQLYDINLDGNEYVVGIMILWHTNFHFSDSSREKYKRELEVFDGVAPKLIHLGFYIKDNPDKPTEIVGNLRHKSIKLFSILANILRKLVSEHDVTHILMFASKDQPSRMKLYRHLVEKFCDPISDEATELLAGFIDSEERAGLKPFAGKIRKEN